MSQELEKYLQQALNKLENLRRKIGETQGYNEEAQLCRMLEELIKEQKPHEDTGHTAHASR